MKQTIAHVAYLVRDYDEAIAFFTDKLGFDLIEDTKLNETKRWVLVCPRGGGSALLLAKADSSEQAQAIGNQAGGRVFLFLHTDDFWRDFNIMQERGVEFLEEPREEAYGIVAVFKDLYGNKWDLLQRK
jgi:catechol 2,3-dioxygenase-like lactoylglutathione lyase family enzyme